MANITARHVVIGLVGGGSVGLVVSGLMMCVGEIEFSIAFSASGMIALATAFLAYMFANSPWLQ